MPVWMAICCVAVTCVAWDAARSTLVLPPKCSQLSYAGKPPPSRDSATWILVSLVIRVSEAQRIL